MPDQAGSQSRWVMRGWRTFLKIFWNWCYLTINDQFTEQKNWDELHLYQKVELHFWHLKSDNSIQRRFLALNKASKLIFYCILCFTLNLVVVKWKKRKKYNGEHLNHKHNTRSKNINNTISFWLISYHVVEQIIVSPFQTDCLMYSGHC